MPKLTFTVEVSSDNPESDQEYLNQLDNCFQAVINLRSWGYTDDEMFAYSKIGLIADDTN